MFTKIVQAGCAQLSLPKDLVEKLVTYIDVLKIKGYSGGFASSKFGDYLGFLRVPDNEVTQQFFGDRWVDHKVHIQISDDLKQYLNTDTPLFTPNRLEPVYSERPFYKQGNTAVPPGANVNPDNHGTVRRPAPLTETYSNFIVMANVPNEFCIEVLNANLAEILADGLPSTNRSSPYKLYTSAGEARDHLFHDLAALGHQRNPITMKATDYTLLSLSSDKLELNNEVFYTKRLHGHRRGSRSHGYYYLGAVGTSGLAVSAENKTTL